MNSTVIQDKALRKIHEIHKLSQDYNSKIGHNHADKLLKLIQEHAEEIQELHSQNNPHYLTETGDLIILCFQLLINTRSSIDEVLLRCFKRYETKLPKLIQEVAEQ